MTARLLAICSGPAARLRGTVDGREVDVLSGIVKRPLSVLADPVEIAFGRLGVAGDEQADLTVHGGRAMPDVRFADDIVLAAMGIEARPEVLDPDAPPPPGSGTYSIDSRARLREGRSAHLSVVLRMGGNGLPGSTYTPLRWQAGSQ